MATFQVDLRGMVDLLSRNLYSGPRVYVRELLQNTVDAIAARRLQDPDCPATVTITVADGGLTCRDTGIGLTLQEASDLLSTIGASSKRDELGLSRGDYLGQFGIGMLSCFMVSERIRVLSRSARQPQAPTVEWVGRTDGTYAVRALEAGEDGLDEPGTLVELDGLPGEPWLRADTVRALVDEFGSLLPIDVEVRSGQGGATRTRHAHQEAPWELSRREQRRWCAETLDAEPFDIIDLKVPAAGLRGLAVITSAHPTATAHHTAYVKRMLVSRSAEGLVPEWAYFVRVVADAAHLRLTASREQLVDDDLRAETREAIGAAVRSWLERMARAAPRRFAEFVAAHAVGLRSVAISDADMLELVVRHAPVESTLGPRTLAQLAASGKPVRFTRTVDQYRALADVASSQGIVLVNAGYAYEEEVIAAFLARPDLLEAGADIALVDPGELLEAFSPCSPAEEAQAIEVLMLAAQAIDPEDCEVVMRRFEPATLPALYLPDPDLAGRVAARTSTRAATGVWSEILGVTDPFAGSPVPRLVLNRTNPLVVRLVSARADDAVVTRTLRGLYIQCLLLGHQPLGPKERSWAAEALGSLLDSALPQAQ
ncbi:HSP90 family protein [Actinomyces slackii]|uniref:High temperature protein G n=2 Tax=Actinomyces slackii TaxID=52774 RepID=A0A3S4WJC6_9ACTO|nr:HSP90 family protein [Actinomyces slackii]VEG74184.1 High temperature protein G [Actinomyces slackii]